MTNDAEMGSWTYLLHSSSKLLEQAAPSAQFPPLQRNLDQLEALSKKLKAKTLRTEAPTQSIAATRLLAREGINAEQLARDLKSFELKFLLVKEFKGEIFSERSKSLIGLMEPTIEYIVKSIVMDSYQIWLQEIWSKFLRGGLRGP